MCVYRSAFCELFRVASTKSAARHDVYRHAARISLTTGVIGSVCMYCVYMCISTLGVRALKKKMWVCSICIWVCKFVLCFFVIYTCCIWSGIHCKGEWNRKTRPRDVARMSGLNCWWCGPFFFFPSLLSFFLFSFLNFKTINKHCWKLDAKGKWKKARILEHFAGEVQNSCSCTLLNFVVLLGAVIPCFLTEKLK